jgi:hypothetical protein
VFESYGIFIEPDWDDFSKLLKVDIKDNKALALSQSHLVLQAAITGQGVAIARSILQ